MKKHIVIFLLFAFLLSGCSVQKKKAEIVETISTDLVTYYKMSDGTWQTDTNTYKHRIEITGRMHNAAKDSTFVYLSNLEYISFDRAWKAAGYSSNTNDYFSPEEAVLVDVK